jgi:hypothetical protein
LVVALTGCASPEVQARTFLKAQFPPGSDAARLRKSLERRSYWQIATDCREPVPFMTPAYCPRGPNAQKSPTGTTCMVRARPYFLASGNYVCWTEANGKILSTRADWLGGALPPSLTQPQRGPDDHP